MRLLATALLLAGTLAFAQTPAKDAKKPAAKAEAKPAAGGFVGNKDSKTLHRADCKMAAKLKPENKVTFATKAEAEKAGFKPCKVCKP